MQYAESELSEILSKHKLWMQLNESGVRANLEGANLEGANLAWANLEGANLAWANLLEAYLRGADLDYSCWPLWCGSLGVIVDARIARQLAYHFCAVECDDPDYIKARNSILWFANQFHRAGECGTLERLKEGTDD